LSEKTGLTYSQVVNWTTNVRKRNLKATVENGKKPHHFLDFLFLAQHRDNKHAPKDDNPPVQKAAKGKARRPKSSGARKPAESKGRPATYGLSMECVPSQMGREVTRATLGAPSDATELSFQEPPPLPPSSGSWNSNNDSLLASGNNNHAPGDFDQGAYGRMPSLPPTVGTAYGQMNLTTLDHRYRLGQHHHTSLAHPGEPTHGFFNDSNIGEHRLHHGATGAAQTKLEAAQAHNYYNGTWQNAWPVTPSSGMGGSYPHALARRLIRSEHHRPISDSSPLHTVSGSFGSATSPGKMSAGSVHSPLKTEAPSLPQFTSTKQTVSGLRMSPITTVTSRDDECEDEVQDYWEMIVERDSPDNILNIFVSKEDPDTEKSIRSNKEDNHRNSHEDSKPIAEKLSEEDINFAESMNLEDYTRSNSLNSLLSGKWPTRNNQRASLSSKKVLDFDIVDLDSSMNTDEFELPPNIDFFGNEHHAAV
jgi:hypothetical protein